MKRFSLFALLAVLLVSCGSVHECNNGVVIDLKNQQAKHLRLTVVSDSIIRVSATAERRFADEASLITVPQSAKPVYQVMQSGDTVCLSTAAVRAYVLCTTGRVWFTSADGTVLLSEVEGGRTFAPYTCQQIHADGTPETYHGWTTRQVFENLYPEESLFGLGQHQGDEWNWKGRDEELFQYNTKVSLPFVVSNLGYGVLFDSYSLCRFGNPKPYSQLQELFELTDKNGEKGALTGTYTAPGEETLVRREDSIYFEDIFTTKNLPTFPLQHALVTYEGTITPRESGEYRFCHYYSGYQRLYINDQPLSDEIWRTAWNPNARKYQVTMEAGKPYSIRLEWKPDGGEAYCGLRAYAPVDSEEQLRLSFWSEMTKQQDYYFIYGATADGVVKGYRQLTGKAPIMPKWVHGYWQSRERYKTQDEILTALDGFRKRHLPIDNIVMDWNYWVDDQWGAFQFDPARFADPQEMIDSIHRQDARIMISCWPKYYLGTDNYRELQDKGYIYQQSIKDSLYDWLGYHYAFYDAYQPEARRIFWRQLYENLGVLGMDAWWMDASEPNVRDCTPIAYRKLLCGPTYLGSSDEYFNAYALVNAEAIYDGQRETQHDSLRVFLLTRNGFVGQQRYSTATWSGDIGTRWEDMKAQVTAGLNFSIAGIPYWSQDIGGFSVENRYQQAQQLFDNSGVENDDLREWRELNVRWHQWGMFTPMYRSHGQFPFREPWNIAPEGHPAYKAIAECLNLRYRLMPYIYSLAGDVHFHDYTMLRPLVMDYPNDPVACRTAYQFMFGPAFMVCPVLQYGARSREVYLPESKWYDFFSNTLVGQGGETCTLAAPYEHTPILVRAGSIVPFGPACEHTAGATPEQLTIRVYMGADGAFTLYEDAGTDYTYEQGEYSRIPFSYDDAKHQLTIGSRQGQYAGMPAERQLTVLFIGDHTTCTRTLTYTGAEVVVEW